MISIIKMKTIRECGTWVTRYRGSTTSIHWQCTI